MRKLLTLLFLLTVPAGSMYAQLSVQHVNSNAAPITGDGLFYSLPRTVVAVTVKIDRVEHYKGPYADFALRFLGLKNVILSNSVEYRINGISIDTYAEPDPDQCYFIAMGDKTSKAERESVLSLSRSGIIMGTLPGQGEDQTSAPPAARPASSLETGADAFGELFKYSADVSVFEKVDTIIRKISMDTVTVERQYYKRTVVEKSPEQKAREAADFISKIKENRFNLLSGTQEVNYNKETLQYMDEQLSRMEKEYVKLFTGITVHKDQSYTYTYIPIPNQVNITIPIFRFHSSRGVVDLDEPGGKVVTIRIQRGGGTQVVAGYLGKAEKESKTRGLAYRIPEMARVSVKLDENIQQETQCMIPQLGVVTTLPANRWKAAFHEETGGIRSLILQ